MSSNVVIGIPSGQIFNCNSGCKYDLLQLKLAKYLSYYNDNIFDEYAFLDKNTIKVKRIIKRSLTIGTKLYHSQYGVGEITAIFGPDGWIINFRENTSDKKKMYIDNSMLIQDLRFELL